MYALWRHQRWMIWLAAAFAVYVAALLANAYRSQDQLRSAAEARVLADHRQLAAVLRDFVSDQQVFAAELARSHEIEAYLANRALGMSMRYGLGASLFDVQQRFRRAMAEKTSLGLPVYRRIVYLDEFGAPAADTSPGEPLPRLPADAGSGERMLVDDRFGQLVVRAAVELRGTPGGSVVTVADTAPLLRHLAVPTADSGIRQMIVTDAGAELTSAERRSQLVDRQSLALAGLPGGTLTALSSLPVAAVGDLRHDFGFALRMPVHGTRLSLVSLLSDSMLYGRITSRSLLYAASAVPFMFLLGGLWIDRMRRRTRRLEADVVASNRSRAELADRNDALTVEIARREALEAELRASEERYRTYIEHAPGGIFVVDGNGRFVDANPSACAMVGFEHSELLARTLTDLAPPEQRVPYASAFERVKRDGAMEMEFGLRRKDGSHIEVSLRAIALPGGLIMGFCVDVTERKRAELQIRHLAYFDPLTGLPNRRLLMDRMRRAMSGASRTREYGALLILDLDHFKDLNDTQGHDVGDRLLVDVARRLEQAVRQEDTVSRLGGDEYVVVAEALGTDEATAALHAETIAEKVHRALSLPYELVDGRPAHHSTPSIGVTLYRGQDVALDILLKQADVALYQAKSAGRNAIRFFSPDMQAAIDARAATESALRQALQRHELRLHYQPQLDRQGRITGAEALLRWIPADGVPVPPARFIPVAEETGLILPIGDWVLAQACAQLARWQSDAHTRELTLSINVSARQFHQPGFVTEVRSHVAHAGIDPRRLKLELTESVVLDRVDEVIRRMRELKAAGIGFSLDDFGTGYSSLSYLKRLPLDEVKIDKSFVRDITHDQNDAAIVRAVLAMSQSLGLMVVAEGVETEAQHAFLLRHGCEHFQGFLFGRPAPIEQWPPAGQRDDDAGATETAADPVVHGGKRTAVA